MNSRATSPRATLCRVVLAASLWLWLALYGCWATACCRPVCGPAPATTKAPEAPPVARVAPATPATKAPPAATAPRATKALPAPLVTIAKVPLVDGSTDYEGVCATSPLGPAQIHVRAGLSPQREAVVLAHELGHALGLGHSTDVRSIMWYTGGDLRVCPEADVEAARRARFPMHVRATGCDPEALRLACAYWNDALGREQFVVAPVAVKGAGR